MAAPDHTLPGSLHPDELHEMFALVSSRLLGPGFEVQAAPGMRLFNIGMVTHMRPKRWPALCEFRHGEEAEFVSLDSSSYHAATVSSSQATFPLDFSTNPNSCEMGFGKHFE